MRRKRIFGASMAAVLALIIIITACGKKGDPLPPRLQLPMAISDLSARAAPEGIVLKWSQQGPFDGGFRISRSETAAGSACPRCPQDYRTLATVAGADERLGREGGGRFHYVDTAVKEGFFYSYRVAVRDRSGNYGKESNEAGAFGGRR